VRRYAPPGAQGRVQETVFTEVSDCR